MSTNEKILFSRCRAALGLSISIRSRVPKSARGTLANQATGLPIGLQVLQTELVHLLLPCNGSLIQPKKDERKIERVLIIAAPVREDPAPDLTQVKEPLDPAELALLREFFELLAEWDEAQKGEPRDG